MPYTEDSPRAAHLFDNDAGRCDTESLFGIWEPDRLYDSYRSRMPEVLRSMGKRWFIARVFRTLSLGEYAMEYARLLQNRAKGMETQQPRIPVGLFEPNRNLIRSTLDRTSEKYFRTA